MLFLFGRGLMMKHLSRPLFPFAVTILLSAQTTFGQFPAATEVTTYRAAKREFRGAWIATVTNLDWPSSGLRSTGVSQEQKDALVSILDQLARAGFNAVVFQVRTECDALYNSPYEPWSYWLTGMQGTPPSPFYDPLQFAVEEAHKRGMEIHAWFNPYRAVRPSTYTRASSHVSNTHPEWLLTFSYVNASGSSVTQKILDPGLPAVRDYVAMVVSDIVRRYDVDGIHADDYFYPYPDGTLTGITNQDDVTYAQNNPSSLDRGTWRRENVNILLKQISDSTKAIKPNVKFGMSPFGIWKNGVPSGVFGLDAYSTIYCDPIAWLQRRYVDYLTPQLYWAFGSSQDYALLQPWWADSTNANGRHLYTGIATYRTGNPYSVTEIPNQINYNRGNPKVQGSIQFRALSVTANPLGIYDLLKSDVFQYASIIPSMSWKPDATPPNAPSALTTTSLGPNSYGLQWNPPSAAADGDTAMRYAVYRFTTPTPQQSDRDNPKNIIALKGLPTAIPPFMVDTTGVQYYYTASAVDRNNNESTMLSNVAPIIGGAIPTQPTLAFPADSEQNFPKGGAIKWRGSPNALAYRVEFDSTGTLGPTSMLVQSSITDTMFVPTGLAPQKTYYWKVAAGNQVGASGYSVQFSFKTGWPFPPEIVSPNGISGVLRIPTFVWTKSSGTSFQIQITDYTTRLVVIDTTVTDSTYTSTKILEPVRIYTWKVAAYNSAGASDWSAEGRFRTSEITLVEAERGIPTEYSLSQNYPNPFNPVTKIEVSVPRLGRVVLRVYDVLGRTIASLVDEELAPGLYTFRFDGTALPSGMYLYVMNVGETRMVKKMMLIR